MNNFCLSPITSTCQFLTQYVYVACYSEEIYLIIYQICKSTNKFSRAHIKIDPKMKTKHKFAMCIKNWFEHNDQRKKIMIPLKTYQTKSLINKRTKSQQEKKNQENLRLIKFVETYSLLFLSVLCVCFLSSRYFFHNYKFL